MSFYEPIEMRVTEADREREKRWTSNALAARQREIQNRNELRALAGRSSQMQLEIPGDQGEFLVAFVEWIHKEYPLMDIVVFRRDWQHFSSRQSALMRRECSGHNYNHSVSPATAVRNIKANVAQYAAPTVFEVTLFHLSAWVENKPHVVSTPFPRKRVDDSE